MTQTPVSPRDATPHRPLSLGLMRGVAVATAAGVLLALTGAFGMGAPLLFRLGYWLPLMWLGALGAICARGWSSAGSTWTSGRC